MDRMKKNKSKEPLGFSDEVREVGLWWFDKKIEEDIRKNLMGVMEEAT